MRIWKGWCEARDSAKQTERSLKGKGIGDLLRFAKPANRSYGKCDVCNLCAVVINCRNICRGVGLPLPKHHCNYQKAS